MKIQCDVCSKKEASVFCIADEASLCDSCDYRVHHANKLASKHQRFSLIYPSSFVSPLCDICQEKKAYVFCQQDRAILCRDCEIPLHSANEHTQKHDRFLLTGIKLSAISDNQNQNQNQDRNLSFDCQNGYDQVPEYCKALKSKPSSEISSVLTNNNNGGNDWDNQQLGSDGSTSSISEYLIETLPGWHFEDFFLDSSSPSPFGFCKNAEETMSFLDVDPDKDLTTYSSQFENNLGIRVPQAPPQQAAQSRTQFRQPGNENNQGGKLEETISVNAMINKVGRNWRKDIDGFTVPQFIQSVGHSKKKPRFW